MRMGGENDHDPAAAATASGARHEPTYPIRGVDLSFMARDKLPHSIQVTAPCSLDGPAQCSRRHHKQRRSEGTAGPGSPG